MYNFPNCRRQIQNSEWKSSFSSPQAEAPPTVDNENALKPLPLETPKPPGEKAPNTSQKLSNAASTPNEPKKPPQAALQPHETDGPRDTTPPADEQNPGVVAISPQKRPVGRVAVEKQYMKEIGTTSRGGMHLYQRHGLEKFSLRALIVRDFSEDEFLGHYRVDRERVVSIIDGRERFGGLLIYDSKTGLFRVLHRFGKLIYVYGDKVDDTDSIAGNIIVLASKDHTLVVPNPSRIMWTPEPAVRTFFGTKVYWTETNPEIPGLNSPSLLLDPWERKAHPAMIMFADPDTEQEDILFERARFLADKGWIVLLLGPRCDCPNAKGTWGLDQIQAAIAFLLRQEHRPPVSDCGRKVNDLY